MLTYSQLHRTDKYSQHSSTIWPVWLNGRVFVYKLSDCGFESCCCNLNFCRQLKLLSYVTTISAFKVLAAKNISMLKLYQVP